MTQDFISSGGDFPNVADPSVPMGGQMGDLIFNCTAAGCTSSNEVITVRNNARMAWEMLSIDPNRPGEQVGILAINARRVIDNNGNGIVGIGSDGGDWIVVEDNSFRFPNAPSH